MFCSKSLHPHPQTTYKKLLTPLAIIYFKQLQESCIQIEILRSYTHSHTLPEKHKQSRAAIPNPIVVNMKPASFRRWGVFGPHIPIRPVSKAIPHNAAQRTAAEQDFDFPQCDCNFIFLKKSEAAVGARVQRSFSGHLCAVAGRPTSAAEDLNGCSWPLQQSEEALLYQTWRPSPRAASLTAHI